MRVLRDRTAGHSERKEGWGEHWSSLRIFARVVSLLDCSRTGSLRLASRPWIAR